MRCEGVGTPILSAVCYCRSCQQGGHQIEALPGAPRVLDDDGGTPYLTYRDDRFHCVEGLALLKAYRINDDSPTQRMVATCCNSGMLLKFGPGHWTSAYRVRFFGDLPPIEMRNQIAHRTADTDIPRDAPHHKGFPPRLFYRLLAARIAMAFGR